MLKPSKKYDPRVSPYTLGIQPYNPVDATTVPTVRKHTLDYDPGRGQETPPLPKYDPGVRPYQPMNVPPVMNYADDLGPAFRAAYPALDSRPASATDGHREAGRWVRWTYKVGRVLKPALQRMARAVRTFSRYVMSLLRRDGE